MRERKVYLGPFNNSKKDQLHEKALSYLKENKGERFYYLLPNSVLLKNYRKKFIHEAGSTFELNLFTFDDVVNEIVQVDFLRTLNDPMKSLILRNILAELAANDELSYYKDFIHMKGFIESIISIIREIKRSLLTVDMYFEKSPKDEKYKEIGIIYKKYEETLQLLHLTDRESDYLNSIAALKERKEYLSSLDFIIIDEFYDFRPVELEIIRELYNRDIDIYINIPFNNQSNNRILKHTIDKLKEIGFNILFIENHCDNLFHSLSDRLFSFNEEKIPSTENIELIVAPSIYLEYKKIIREIKMLLAKGESISDIGLVVLSDSYLKPLFKVAQEENLPLKLGGRTSLIQLPMVKEFCNLIHTKINSTRNNIINRVKSSYFPMCTTNKEEMEYILRRLSFNNLEDLERLLNDNKELMIPLSSINDLIALVDNLKKENSGIPPVDKIIHYNEYFLDLIHNYKVDKIVTLIGQNNPDLFHRDLATLEKLKALLLKMNEIDIITDEISLEDYYPVLEDYLLSETILEFEEDLNGLNVLQPINIRGTSFKYLFVVGLSQENYPKIDNHNFFLNDDNYRSLKDIGIDYMDYFERFSNEALKFITIISSCRERLYMSYSENENEGKSIPSMFLEEVLWRIDGDDIKDKTKRTSIPMDYLISSKIEDSTSMNDFTNSLLYNYFGDKLERDYIPLHKKMDPGTLLEINEKTKIQLQRAASNYNHYSGKLDREDIIELLANDLGEMVYSISYLEGYSQCPYRFMLNNYFKVEEMGREVEAHTPIDMGSIYHGVLYNYYNKYKKDLEKDLDGFDVHSTLDYLREITFKECAAKGYKEDLKGELLIIENIYLRLSNFILEDIQKMKKDKRVPCEFEVEFGRNDDFALELEGKKIRFRGVIDRIDKLVESHKYLVMDYKSSSYGKKDLTQIESGLSLQLPVYIMSQKERDIIAGAYSTISDGKFHIAMGILGEASFINNRQKGSMDRAKWTQTLDDSKEKIFKIVENISNGDFSVAPLDCSPYCPYKDICRYEKVLEVE